MSRLASPSTPMALRGHSSKRMIRPRTARLPLPIHPMRSHSFTATRTAWRIARHSVTLPPQSVAESISWLSAVAENGWFHLMARLRKCLMELAGCARLRSIMDYKNQEVGEHFGSGVIEICTYCGKRGLKIVGQQGTYYLHSSENIVTDAGNVWVTEGCPEGHEIMNNVE